jgi:hypothetical protein
MRFHYENYNLIKSYKTLFAVKYKIRVGCFKSAFQINKRKVQVNLVTDFLEFFTFFSIHQESMCGWESDVSSIK